MSRSEFPNPFHIPKSHPTFPNPFPRSHKNSHFPAPFPTLFLLFQVNGTMVTNSSHLEVVKLIKCESGIQIPWNSLPIPMEWGRIWDFLGSLKVFPLPFSQILLANLSHIPSSQTFPGIFLPSNSPGIFSRESSSHPLYPKFPCNSC